jgi:hypothetical protein
MDTEDINLLRKYNDLYLEIILRYKEQIEEKETLYASDLPTLVSPHSESVVSLAAEFKGERYDPDKDFIEAAKKAYDYVRDKITNVNLPIKFWLKPEQVIKHSAGEHFDRYILLCSLLLALGNYTSKVIVAENEQGIRPAVYFIFSEIAYMVDFEEGIKEFEGKEHILGYLKNNSLSIYEFNDKSYDSLF